MRARVKSATTRGQSGRIALPTQAAVSATTAAAVNTFPVATLWHRRVAPQVPNSTAKQQTQMGPQRPPGIPTPRVPRQCGPQPAEPGHQEAAAPLPPPCSTTPPPIQATAGRTTGQPMKVCHRVSSWATQQLAEQQTVSCSSCMLPTVHQGATTARHHSDPCSSSHPKCRVNLSNLGRVNDS